jgi:hypothetical protein
MGLGNLKRYHDDDGATAEILAGRKQLENGCFCFYFAPARVGGTPPWMCRFARGGTRIACMEVGRQVPRSFSRSAVAGRELLLSVNCCRPADFF